MIRSPQSGYVVDKKIVAGRQRGSEDDAAWRWPTSRRSGSRPTSTRRTSPFSQVGQKVEATVEACPNRTFTGKLALIYPQLDAATRTNRVRFELDNPRHELRPGMFATVRINTPLESIEPFKSAGGQERAIVLAGSGRQTRRRRDEFLAVPERAVIDTGAKKVVYVEREPGLFEGVEVELGPRHGDYYPVVKGLKPGDKVAAAGGFLIDAETRLNPAAASTYFGASGGPQSNGRPSRRPSRRRDRPAHASRSPGRAAEARPRRRSRRPQEHRATARGRPASWRSRSAFARHRRCRWARWACR